MTVPHTEASQREDGRTLHRRETRQQIVLPFLVGCGIVAAAALGAALINDPLAMQRVAIIADFTYISLVLCPMMLCMLPVYLLMVAAVYGLNRLHQGTEAPLQRLEAATEALAERVERVTQQINQRVVDANAQLAPWIYWLRFFDQQEDKHAD